MRSCYLTRMNPCLRVEPLEERRLLTAVEWRVEDGGNGHFYELVSEQATWIEARAMAVAAGGHLATITSEEENRFVFELMNQDPNWRLDGARRPFLGGMQATAASGDYSINVSEQPKWRWVTDEPWSFAEWSQGEPNNFLWEPVIHYGFTSWTFQWNNISALNKGTGYVIEYDEFFDSELASEHASLTLNDASPLATDLGVVGYIDLLSVPIRNGFDRDYFTFTAAISGGLQVDIESSSNQWDLEYYAFPAGEEPTWSSHGARLTTLQVEEGRRYQLRIAPAEDSYPLYVDSFNYRLRLQVTPEEIYEPNDDADSAPLIENPLIDPMSGFYLDSQDSVDYFRFNAFHAEAWRIAVVSELADQLNLRVLGLDGQPLSIGATSAGELVAIQEGPVTGDEFIVEVSSDSATPVTYDLSVGPIVAISPSVHFDEAPILGAMTADGGAFAFLQPDRDKPNLLPHGFFGVEATESGLYVMTTGDRVVTSLADLGEQSDFHYRKFTAFEATPGRPTYFAYRMVSDGLPLLGNPQMETVAVYRAVADPLSNQEFAIGQESMYFAMPGVSTANTLAKVLFEANHAVGREVVLERISGGSVSTTEIGANGFSELLLLDGNTSPTGLLRVTRRGSDVDETPLPFTITISANTAGDDQFEPNELKQDAFDLGEIGAARSSLTIVAAIADEEDDDWFTLEVTADGYLEITRPDYLGVGVSGFQTESIRPFREGMDPNRVVTAQRVKAGDVLSILAGSHGSLHSYEIKIEWRPLGQLLEPNDQFISRQSNGLTLDRRLMRNWSSNYEWAQVRFTIDQPNDVDHWLINGSDVAFQVFAEFDRDEVDLVMQVVDESGTVLAESQAVDAGATLAAWLPAGVQAHNLRISSRSGTGEYRLVDIQLVSEMQYFDFDRAEERGISAGFLVQKPATVANIPQFVAFRAASSGDARFFAGSGDDEGEMQIAVYDEDRRQIAGAVGPASGVAVVASIEQGARYYAAATPTRGSRSPVNFQMDGSDGVEEVEPNDTEDDAIQIDLVDSIVLQGVADAFTDFWRLVAKREGKLSTPFDRSPVVHVNGKESSSGAWIDVGDEIVVQVEPRSGAPVAYSYEIQIVDRHPEEARDSLADATPFVGHEPRVFLDGVEDVDLFQYYPAYDGRSQVNLKPVTDELDRYRLEVLNAVGEVIVEARPQGGMLVAAHHVNAGEEKYFVRVSAIDQAPTFWYSLSASQFFEDDFEPDESPGKAVWLTPDNEFGVSHRSFYGGDDEDWFVFAPLLSGTANVRFDSQFRSREIEVEVLGQDGPVLATLEGVTLEEASFFIPVEAGEAYFVRATSTWLPEYSVHVSTPRLEGDVNRDCMVDLSDFAALKTEFGEAVVPGRSADLNGDAVVDLKDFNLLKANFGADASCPAQAIRPTTFQAEDAKERVSSSTYAWSIVDAVSSGVGAFTGASGPDREYLQALNLSGGIGGANLTPGLPVARFEFSVAAAGEYSLEVRAAGLSGTTDSMWVRIVDAELADAQGRSVVNDSLLVGVGSTGRFSFIDAGIWTLAPGVYTIEVAMRESGAALDALVVTPLKGKNV